MEHGNLFRMSSRFKIFYLKLSPRKKRRRLISILKSNFLPKIISFYICHNNFFFLSPLVKIVFSYKSSNTDCRKQSFHPKFQILSHQTTQKQVFAQILCTTTTHTHISYIQLEVNNPTRRQSNLFVFYS